jgi:siroheme synthase-like protein
MLLDVTNRPIVIVGGGMVAARKAEALLAAGATKITVISKAFIDGMPAAVTRVTGDYRSFHLKGAGLVFAATSSHDVNAAVVRDAQKKGILVCRVDQGEDAGDFTSMATYRDASVVLAVSATGSPAVAARVRDQVGAALDRDLVLLADANAQLRPLVLGFKGLSDTQRRDILRRLASDEAIAQLKAGGMQRLTDWLKASIAVSTTLPQDHSAT